MELREYIRPFRKWWWLIIGATLVATVSSFFATRQQPPIYSTRATVMIGSAIENPNPNGNEFWLTQQLAATHGPVVAATDYVRAVPDTVRAWVPAGRRFITLGTDGFGRSDTRAALRSYFGVDAEQIARVARQLMA